MVALIFGTGKHVSDKGTLAYLYTILSVTDVRMCLWDILIQSIVTATKQSDITNAFHSFMWLGLIQCHCLCVPQNSFP
jgi:hypothetical protein